MANYIFWIYDSNMLILSILVAIICTYIGRYVGREYETCPTWKDKLELLSLLIVTTFCNWFFIFLLITATVAWINE